VFDVGRQIIAPILYRKKIRSVDMVILSHPNSDHLNGLLHILKQFNVQTVWTNGDIADTAGYREFITIIQEKGINHPNDPLIPSQTTIGGVEVSILHPPSDSHTHNDINANSLVFRAGMGSVSFLFTGDITAESERQLIMSAGAWLQSTVLTVPHHGSVTSSTAAFIAAVDPATAIISAGFHNRYHMPHAAVLKRYHQHGCRVYRTDIQGAISAVTDGTAIRFQTAADP
jgi:competence protein ComEC